MIAVDSVPATGGACALDGLAGVDSLRALVAVGGEVSKRLLIATFSEGVCQFRNRRHRTAEING